MVYISKWSVHYHAPEASRIKGRLLFTWMQSARPTEITALTIIKALNDNVCTLRFSSPAIHTTYKVHVTFQTRTEDQLEKSFQFVNA